jgi:hypothetical protein
MLAQALNDCLKASKEAGSPLSLKTFIVGRNRLENEGAIALSEFFKVTVFFYSHYFTILITPYLYLGSRNLGRSPDASKFYKTSWYSRIGQCAYL